MLLTSSLPKKNLPPRPAGAPPGPPPPPGGAGNASAAPSAVLGGGSGIIFDNNSACSLTTIGHDGAGRLVGLTAGHCAPAGARLIAEGTPSGGVIGTVAFSDNGEGLDYAVLQLDPERVTPVRSIGPTTIAGIGVPPGPGGTVCASGRTSGTDCGVVWGSLDGTSINQYCSKPGDSGGPVFVGDQLVGMNQGRLTGIGPIGFDVPCTTAANPVHSPAFFQPIAVILAAVNAQNGIGAGFQPI
ncbi:S1 family peptidase [Nocardia brasiliensis]|uniref:S1 family peptidase n=1 Tax=Nocardia brasiliensis TaxID=37326 RepID=UPI0024586C6D|nr:S1 family peptidase [Nocardia brasiliensis]